MTPERWKQIRDILEPAAELEGSPRELFINDKCGSDADLKREVEALLTADNTRAEMLESDAASTILNRPGDRSGDRVGAYEIIRELGTGGMGAVYLARRADGAFDQNVALKLIKRGMDSDAILRRFVTERQILASLEHPNIARLVGGGTTDDGLPYFVMEYVEGNSIIEYAERSGLSLDKRLDLFREVCSAVSFAHQNLVIHRDLKPSNILVTKDGQIKLLDFGIAKLLKTDGDLRTATQNFVFTPEYASPEQVRGEQLTTASDVYSLGVILYELLSGQQPYSTEGKNIGEIVRAVCETEPTAPSRGWRDAGELKRSDTRENALPRTRPFAASQLRGDLDNIILKALRKDSERRYSSVEQLAEDIRRHQRGLPVTAVKDTLPYRASKFFSRNRLAVAAAAIVLIVLSAGLFATLYQRNKAQQRFNDVRQLATSFLFEFHDAIENLPGSTPARELVVKRAVEYLDQLSDESEGDATLRRDLATAYAKIGQIQGNSYHANLGDSAGAMRSYARSLELRQALVNADPANNELQHELADSYEGVGDMHYTVDDLEKGLASYEEVVAIREKLVSAEPGKLEYQYSLAGVLGKRGDISGMEGFANLGDIPRALDSYRRGIGIYERLLRAAPENDKYRSGFATMLHFYGMLQSSTGDSKGAIDNGRRSIEIFESLIAANPDNAKYETHFMSALVFLRYPLVDEQLFDEALANGRRVIKTMERQVAADPKNAFARRSLGVSYNALGRIQTDMNDGASAVGNHQKALAIAQEMADAEPENGQGRRDLAMTREFLADALAAKGDHLAAIESYRIAIGLYGPTSGEDLSAAYSGLGKCLAATGNLGEGVESFRQALPSAEKAALKSPLNVRRQSRLAIFYLNGAKVLTRLAASQNAEPTLVSEAKEWLGKSSEIFGVLQSTGRLSKLHAKYPGEIDAEYKRLPAS